MSEENTQGLEAEMLSAAQEALEADGGAEEPVWQADSASEAVEEPDGSEDGQTVAPEDDSESASDEPQSDEKQEEQKLIPQAALERAISKERQKKREAFDRVDQLEAEKLELIESARLLQARLEQLNRIVLEREAMDPAESRMTEYEWKLQNVEAEKRIREQQQAIRARAAEERQVAEYRQQFMDEAAELEQELGVPAPHILIRFADAPKGTPMRQIAEKIYSEAYERMKGRLAKEHKKIVDSTPEPFSAQAKGRRDLTNYESDDELTNNMLLSLKQEGFIGS